jgi:hypothetical protein
MTEISTGVLCGPIADANEGRPDGPDLSGRKYAEKSMLARGILPETKRRTRVTLRFQAQFLAGMNSKLGICVNFGYFVHLHY